MSQNNITKESLLKYTNLTEAEFQTFSYIALLPFLENSVFEIVNINLVKSDEEIEDIFTSLRDKGIIYILPDIHVLSDNYILVNPEARKVILDSLYDEEFAQAILALDYCYLQFCEDDESKVDYLMYDYIKCLKIANKNRKQGMTNSDVVLDLETRILSGELTPDEMNIFHTKGYYNILRVLKSLKKIGLPLIKE